MAVLSLIGALLLVLIGLGALTVWIEVVGRKCSACGTRRTFTWVSVTSEAREGAENVQVHTNRYCFHCCDFTARDDRARPSLEAYKSYQWALSHYQSHQRQDKRKVASPPLTTV